ncbi:multicopper oxidase family protein [Sulfurovum mangrovi]|uniref:multicopper oxidase family protein n=1 Tax=Sulfurovum mangrovi TaxID=2893889 RepID=UPI001E46C877|nr:multicopper oxidase family protein [Sulfurovum mangrovi]UFH60092.1 multicopper oxidase family protein [Sulfurovum mangrovi]
MNRRYFLHYSAVTAAYLFSGCEERSGRDKNRPLPSSSSSPIPNASIAEAMTEKIMPFTRKLKVPNEIDFSQVKKAAFSAQKGQVNIFPDAPTEVLTFQGDLPNPTIRVKKGELFDLGFTNKLSEKTIIHWHGLIVPEKMDGHPKDAIATGETKHYHYRVNQSAGTFWYHTHPHGRTGKEIYHGLSGFYIIEDETERQLGLPNGEFELPLVIQDRRFDEKRQLFYKDPDVPQDNNGVMGDVILVNATPLPYHEVKTGKYRLRILNGSSVRTYRLAFDTIETFTLIGTDAGLLEEPEEVKSIIISVAERVDIIVDFKDQKIGDRVTLRTLGFKEASNLTLHPDYPPFSAQMDIMQFHVTENFGDTHIVPEKLIDIPRMKVSDAVRTRTITMEIIAGGIWTLDKKPFSLHRVDQRVKLGTTEIWELKNSVHMAHPFHMHGVRFQVLDRDGKISFPTDKGWKDTVIVMPFETVRIIVHFTMPGVFLYHCHILEHEDHSMMANLLVE